MRGRVITDRSGLWKGGPYKPLTEGLRKSGGRNAQGRVTSWHRGGASKRLYRMIDTKRIVRDSPGILERVEYDPNRTARIALVKYPAGTCISYLLHVLHVQHAHSMHLCSVRYIHCLQIVLHVDARICIAMAFYPAVCLALHPSMAWCCSSGGRVRKICIHSCATEHGAW